MVSDIHIATTTLRFVRRTTWASISQFEGMTTDGRPVHVRYKWGELSVKIGPVGGDIKNALECSPAWQAEYGHRHNFDIVWNEVEAVTGLRCIGTVEDKYQ